MATAFSNVLRQFTDPLGDNASRIAAILNGRSPHFSYSTPADPVTTREVTVTSASQFNTEAAVAGTRIIINSSFSGNVQIQANDIDVVMSNSATLTGAVEFGGGSRGPGGYYVNRVRWTGGNVGTLIGVRFNDLLIDDLYALASLATHPGPHPEHLFAAGWTGSTNPNFARFAVLNSTFELVAPPGDGGWAFVNGSSLRDSDLILGNVKLLSTYQNNRFQYVDRLMIFDCAFNPNLTSINGMRLHRNCNPVWINNTWSVGLFKMDQVNTEDLGPSATNVVFDNYDRFVNSVPFEYAIHGGHANTGEIRNSTLYGASMSYGPLTNGGGNSSESWDGVSQRDHSLSGAIR